MRVCMVAYSYYPTDTRIRREAEALVERGDAVTVIALSHERDRWRRTMNGVSLIQLPSGRYRGGHRLMYLVSYGIFFLAAAAILTCLHLRWRYQVIEVHTMPDFMVFAALLPKLLGAKVVLNVHDLMPELYESKYRLPSGHWLIRLIRWMERRSIAFADRAIAVHQPHLEVLVRHGNPRDKFIVLLNLPDPAIFSRAPAPTPASHDGFELVYHGTVSDRHGLDVALRAVARLRAEIPGVRLHVYGEGDAIPHLQRLAQELSLGSSAQIHKGMVPVEELLPRLAPADLGVVPILCDDFTQYMLPVKLLEYVRLGIPVVCSRTETIAAYFDNTMVRYCRAGDAEDLAAQILALYRDPEARRRLRENAGRFNQEYSWACQKLEYFRMLDSLCHTQQPKGVLMQ